MGNILFRNSRHNKPAVLLLIPDKVECITRYKKHLKIMKGQLIMKTLYICSYIYITTLKISNTRSKKNEKQKEEKILNFSCFLHLSVIG